MKRKVKWSRYRAGVAQRVGRLIALLFHDRGTRRGEWSAARPGRTLPPGKTWYSFYMRLGGLQGRSERAEVLFPTGIRSRTVQPVAQSLYRLSYPAHPDRLKEFLNINAWNSKLCKYMRITPMSHHLHYKDQAASDVKGNNRRLFWDSYETHKYTDVWLTMHHNSVWIRKTN